MPTHYDHRQIASWLRVITMILVLFLLGMAIYVGRASSNAIGAILTILIGGGISVLLLHTFSSMRVVVDHEAVSWSFGSGFLNWRLPLSDVKTAYVVRNSWAWGWGIRWTPAGWLYRVSGTSAVELDTGKKKIFLGSDEPERLAESIVATKND